MYALIEVRGQGYDVCLKRNITQRQTQILATNAIQKSIEYNSSADFGDDSNSEPYNGDDITDPDYNPDVISSKYVLSTDSETDENTSSKGEEYVETNDVTNVHNHRINSRTGNVKKNCCFYCNTFFSKLPIHLERKHAEESDVKLFTNLPKGSVERKTVIDSIRKNGNLKYNNQHPENAVAVRRTKKELFKRKVKPCPNCKGFYSLSSLRKHYRRCAQKSLEGKRHLLVMSRKIQKRIHPNAIPVLRNEIFPVLREDAITEEIRYDEVIILYGNKLCNKYRSSHLHKMIRARLRLMGRFLVEMKKIEPSLTDLAAVYNPKFYNATLECINSVAQLDETTGKYKAPATAFSLGTALKYIAELLAVECIKKNDLNKQREVEDFLKILKNDLTTSINKTVSENQVEMKRQKKIILPTTEDIKILHNYLKLERRKYFNEVNIAFNKSKWLELAKLTVVSIQVFNRRRAGEIERVLIKDYRNQQRVNESDNLFSSLSREAQEAAKEYVRFTIRGKLGRGVPVLLNKELHDCCELLLKYREEAGVSDANPYVFGMPHKENVKEHLDAYQILRRISGQCGAKEPHLLRGTGLRKHVATQCMLLDLKENEVKDLANFLGHAEKIHYEHYRMPVATRDITKMSKLLEKVQGGSDGAAGPSNSSNADIASTSTAEDNEDELDTETTRVLHTRKKLGRQKQKKGKSPNKEDLVRLKPRWKPKEIQIIEREFKNHIKDSSYPSGAEIMRVIRKHPELKDRTPKKVRSKIQHLKKMEICRRLFS